MTAYKDTKKGKCFKIPPKNESIFLILIDSNGEEFGIMLDINKFIDEEGSIKTLELYDALDDISVAAIDTLVCGQASIDNVNIKNE